MRAIRAGRSGFMWSVREAELCSLERMLPPGPRSVHEGKGLVEFEVLGPGHWTNPSYHAAMIIPSYLGVGGFSLGRFAPGVEHRSGVP